MAAPPQGSGGVGGGLSWEDIRIKLQTEGAKNVAYDSDLDGLVDKLRTIKRTDLEYPTEDVSFAYLAAINKTVMGSGQYNDQAVIYTSDVFTDKAIDIGVCTDVCAIACLRWSGTPWVRGGDVYSGYQNITATTADFEIIKWIGGVGSILSSEAVDLSDNLTYMYRMSVSGSTLKGFRDDFVTPKIAVTDTDIASGRFGVSTGEGDWHGKAEPLGAYLRAPATQLTQPSAIVEYEITGSGTREDSLRPAIPEDLVEVNPSTLPPEEALAVMANPKGQNGLPLVNALAVTWGAFDYKGEQTMLCAVYEHSPSYLKQGRVLDHIEYAKNKNLLVLKPPRDYQEAIEQHRQIKQQFPDKIAGKDNWAYQMLGHPDFEAMQVADTYHGNVVEGYRPDAYKNVPDWEMRKTLRMWKERLKRATVVKQEAEKHLRKLEEVEKRGW